MQAARVAAGKDGRVRHGPASSGSGVKKVFSAQS
jgi:hypothetical protein